MLGRCKSQELRGEPVEVSHVDSLKSFISVHMYMSKRFGFSKI